MLFFSDTLANKDALFPASKGRLKIAKIIFMWFINNLFLKFKLWHEACIICAVAHSIDYDSLR